MTRDPAHCSGSGFIQALPHCGLTTLNSITELIAPGLACDSVGQRGGLNLFVGMMEGCLVDCWCALDVSFGVCVCPFIRAFCFCHLAGWPISHQQSTSSSINQHDTTSINNTPGFPWISSIFFLRWNHFLPWGENAYQHNRLAKNLAVGWSIIALALMIWSFLSVAVVPRKGTTPAVKAGLADDRQARMSSRSIVGMIPVDSDFVWDELKPPWLQLKDRRSDLGDHSSMNIMDCGLLPFFCLYDNHIIMVHALHCHGINNYKLHTYGHTHTRIYA